MYVVVILICMVYVSLNVKNKFGASWKLAESQIILYSKKKEKKRRELVKQQNEKNL